MIDLQRLKTDVMALGLLALVVFVALSLFSYDPADPPSRLVFPPRAVTGNVCGTAGAAVAHKLRNAFGFGVWFLLFSMASINAQLFSRLTNRDDWIRWAGGFLGLTAVCAALQVMNPAWPGAPLVGSGGYVGAWGSALLDRHFTSVGAFILISATLVAGLLMMCENRFFVALFLLLKLPLVACALPARTVNRIITWRTKRSTIAAVTESDVSTTVADAVDVAVPTPVVTVDEKSVDEESTSLDVRVNPPATLRTRPTPVAEIEQPVREFALPGVELLEHAEDFPYELLAKKARIAAATLEKTFKEFGLNIRVTEIDTGPVITQFELELEAGLRLSKVTALADDLAIALRVPAVRVVAPIPGKNTVGVEVPNEKQVMVRLRELLESRAGELDTKQLPLFLGKDVSGQPLVVDLAKMPHLLIAGRTGTGKSVCLNTLILSLLMTRSPDQVRMLMIDPKMVELSPYRRVPHLMHPVITDMKKAEAVLGWAVEKMEERYDLLARCGVRHLDAYNNLSRDVILDRLELDDDDPEANEIPDKMPYIVIIADEMADMMMTSGKDVEGHIIRLAQKSRAVGIHLVLATQKPTVDVITGLIKSNLPSRISFQVASRTDSRVVLDEMGAERLLGNGDMLFLAPGTSNLNRAQGTYVSDDEMNNIIEFYSDQEPQYSVELAQLSAGSTGASAGTDAPRNHDDQYENAIDVVVREGRGSVSLLQRCLGIGYGRAARLIDYMAEDGIVGDYNGSQAREVLYSPEQWESMKSDRELETAGV